MIVGDTVKLEFGEALVCHKAAIHQVEHENNSPERPAYYQKGKRLHEYIAELAESIGSEWAVAKYYGFDFDPYKAKYKIEADVGKNLEIKWTHWSDGQLIIHEYDRNSDIAVLVTGNYPFYRLAGWIPVVIAKKDRYRHHNQPNWWIAQHHLMPIDTLIRSNYGADLPILPQLRKEN